MHEFCAIWVPEVYLDEDNKLKSLTEGLERARKHLCAASDCHEYGAAIGCQIEECKKSYHYDCAERSGCLMIRTQFQIYCDEHCDLAPADLIENSDEEDSLQKYLCVVCQDPRDEHMTIICEKCDRGWHTVCHEPKVELTPEQLKSSEPWICGECTLIQEQ